MQIPKTTVYNKISKILLTKSHLAIKGKQIYSGVLNSRNYNLSSNVSNKYNNVIGNIIAITTTITTNKHNIGNSMHHLDHKVRNNNVIL